MDHSPVCVMQLYSTPWHLNFGCFSLSNASCVYLYLELPSGLLNAPFCLNQLRLTVRLACTLQCSSFLGGRLPIIARQLENHNKFTKELVRRATFVDLSIEPKGCSR